MVLCRSGRHRSVAVVELLAHVLLLRRGLDVVVSHLSQERLRTTHCLKKRRHCRQCLMVTYGHWIYAEEVANLLDEEWEAGMGLELQGFQ